MANSVTPAQQALNAMLQRAFQEQQQYSMNNPINGNTIPILHGFLEGYNTLNGVLNSIENRKMLKRDNERLRALQEEMDNWNTYTGNNPNVTQANQVLAQNGYGGYFDVPQENVYNVGNNGGFNAGYNTNINNEYNLQPQQVQQTPQVQHPQTNTFLNILNMGLTSVGDNDNLVNQYRQVNPFGLSANGEGQHIADNGSISPEQQLYAQLIWNTYQNTQAQPSQNQVPWYEQNLDGRYSMNGFMQAARERGGNPLIAMMAYNAFAAPMEEEARRARLEENFKIYNDPNATDEMKSRALAGMSYDLQNPDLAYDVNQKRLKDQMLLEDRDYNKQMAMNKIIADMGYIPPGFEQYLDGEMLGEEDEQPSANYSGVNLEGKSWIRNNNNVDLSNAKPNTITGLNHISDIFQKMTGKPLIVTSGNDGKMHASGEFSHGNGWKVDVSGNGLDDPKTRHAFIKLCENLGIKVLDEYENPSPNSTGGHLDLQFSGYTGSKPKKVSDFGMLRKTPKALREEARERRAEARELRAEQREARRAALDEANFKLRLATYDARYGNGATGKGKTKGMTEALIKKYEDAKRDFVNSGRKISELEGKETLVIDGLTGKTKNPYEEEMKNFTKHLDSIYQVEYGNVDTSKVTPLLIATHLYNRINSNEEGEFKMGITENTLADVVSRVVASRNSSVMPKDLKDDLLKVIYNQAEVEKSPNAEMEYHMAEDLNAAMKDYMNNDPETGKPLSFEEWMKNYRPNGKPNRRLDTLYKAYGEYFPDVNERIFDYGG